MLNIYNLVENLDKVPSFKESLKVLFDGSDFENIFLNPLDSGNLQSFKVFESEGSTEAQGIFFNHTKHLCILAKGDLKISFGELPIFHINKINEPKIMILEEVFIKSPLEISCQGPTQLLIRPIPDEKESDMKDDMTHDIDYSLMQYINFMKSEVLNTISQKFNSSIYNLVLTVEALSNAIGENPNKKILDELNRLRAQTGNMRNIISRAVAKSETKGGTEGLRPTPVKLRELLNEVFAEFNWTPEVNYDPEILKADIVIDHFKIKVALREILEFFTQNTPSNYPSIWNVANIPNRDQVEIDIYLSLNASSSPDRDGVDLITTSIPAVDNLPLTTDILESHRGNIQIFEFDSTVKIRLILPKNIWRLNQEPIKIFLVNSDVGERANIAETLSESFPNTLIEEFSDWTLCCEEYFNSYPELIIVAVDKEGLLKNIRLELEKFHEIKRQDTWLLLILDEHMDENSFYTNIATDLVIRPINQKWMVKKVGNIVNFIHRLRNLSDSFISAKQSAERDGLTGLFNRVYLDRKLKEVLEGCKENDTKFSIVMTDVDNFKHYNDNNGHQWGDNALKKFARIMTGAVRASDTVARYGGEEFLIILPLTDNTLGLRIAEKIRTKVESEIFHNQEQQPLGNVTASFGVASYPQDGETVEEVIKAADERLYKAKESGRNRVM